MDRRELVAALRAAQVPEVLYAVPGIHDVPIEPDAHFFLRLEPEGWVVGRRERSQDTDQRWFPTEDEACRYLYDMLTTLPSPRSDAARQIEEILTQREQIQREAWEAFERARRERDRRDEPPSE